MRAVNAVACAVLLSTIVLALRDVAAGAPSPIPPPQAVAAGFTRLAFSDDFVSAETIDLKNTGNPGFKWYLGRPFGYPPSSADTISVSNGVLTITSDSHSNMGILSTRRAGSGWDGFAVAGGAYFEAAIAFDPNVKSAVPRGWPSFWTMDAGHLYTISWPYIEVDFFEYTTQWKGKQTYGAAIHDWIMVPADPKPTHKQRTWNSDNWIARVPGVDWMTFNTVGGLVEPGRGIDFYFNNRLKLSNRFSRYPWMAYADTQPLPVILGSDGWPMRVDWVRVWTR